MSEPKRTIKDGRTQEALNETLKLCVENNILTPFLKSREKEVIDIMTTFGTLQPFFL